MDTSIREQITNLRHTLHACPEISGQEKQIKETLQNFLTAHTSLELLKVAGVDMEQKAPVQDALAVFAQYLDEMERLADHDTV